MKGRTIVINLHFKYIWGIIRFEQVKYKLIFFFPSKPLSFFLSILFLFNFVQFCLRKKKKKKKKDNKHKSKFTKWRSYGLVGIQYRQLTLGKQDITRVLHSRGDMVDLGPFFFFFFFFFFSQNVI
jgi:hypothetical protein